MNIFKNSVIVGLLLLPGIGSLQASQNQPSAQPQVVAVELKGGSPGSYGYIVGRIIGELGEMAELEVVKAVDIPGGHELEADISSGESILMEQSQLITPVVAKTHQKATKQLNKAFARIYSRIRSKEDLGKSSALKVILQAKKLAASLNSQPYLQLAELLESITRSYPQRKAKKNPNAYVEWITVVRAGLTRFDAMTADYPAARITLIMQQGSEIPGVADDDAFIQGIQFLQRFVGDAVGNTMKRFPLSHEYYLGLKGVGEDLIALVRKMETEDWIYDHEVYERRVSWFLEESGEATEVFQKEWIRDARREAIQQIDLENVTDKESVEEAYQQVKSRLAEAEQVLGVVIIDAGYKETLMAEVRERERRAVAKAAVEARQKQQHRENTRAQLLRQIQMDQLFSRTAAERAYKKLRALEKDVLKEGEEPLFGDQQLEKLYQMVESNMPRKAKTERAVIEQLKLLVVNKPQDNKTQIDLLIESLEPQAREIRESKGLAVNLELLRADLIQALKEKELAVRKKDLLKKHKKWYVRLFDYRPLKNHIAFKEEEIKGEFKIDKNHRDGAGSGTFFTKLTPVKSVQSYGATWSSVIWFDPLTNSVRYDLSHPRGPRGMGNAQHSRGEVYFEEGNIRIIGELSRSINSMNRFELSLKPFAIPQPEDVEELGDIENLDTDQSVNKAHRKLVARSSKLGLKVYTLSDTEDWCAEEVDVELSAQSDDFYSGNSVSNFIRKIGVVLVRQCDKVKSAAIVGKNGGDEVLYRAIAASVSGWKPEKI